MKGGIPANENKKAIIIKPKKARAYTEEDNILKNKLKENSLFLYANSCSIHNIDKIAPNTLKL